MDDKNGNEVAKENDSASRSTDLDNKTVRFSRIVYFIVAGLTVLLVVLLAILYLDTDSLPLNNEIRTSVNATGFVYEEYLDAGLDEKVKQADCAILETLKQYEINPNSLDLVDVQIQTIHGEDFHFQVLQIPMEENDTFRKDLSENLRKRLPGAVVAPFNENELVLTIDKVLTHRLLLDMIKTPKYPPVLAGSKMVIVIDDLGEDMKVARGLSNLPFPVTFSIWPNSSNCAAVRKMAKAKDLEILVHLPMQPLGYPDVHPGPQALFVNMDADRIGELVNANIDKIPEAVGVNNHMGSAFTAHETGMNAALSAIRKRGLFFLDSRTTPKSVSRKVAKAISIRLQRRDVFLDNERNVQSILHQLRKTERLAARTGQAIAIGHPHPETLKALQIWASERNQSVAVVKLVQLKPE